MFFDVTEAHYLDNYRIRLRFEDGSAGVADLSGYPNEDNVFRLLLDIDRVKSFRIEFGTIVWGDGEESLASSARGEADGGRGVPVCAVCWYNHRDPSGAVFDCIPGRLLLEGF